MSCLPFEELPISQALALAWIAERQQVCGAPCYLYNLSYRLRHV